MADYTVTLTADQVTAWQEILSTQDITAGLNAHCVTVANNHIEQSVNAQLEAKTLEEKQALLAE